MGEQTEERAAEFGKLPIQNRSPYWTNRSVVKLAGEEDPIDTIIRTARTVVLDAVEAGWSGPPFNPFELANHLGISVLPSDDVADARLVPSAPGGVSIEFNPNNPPARIRFSVAHELAHTLLPDHAQTVRLRGRAQGDDWQLELLCNLAAAEFLMPIGTAGELEDEAIDIENLIRLRKRFEVSTEALLLRMVRLTKASCAVFAAARLSNEGESATFRIDYVVPSRLWRIKLPRGLKVKESTALLDCTAVGFTSKKVEKWSESLPEFHVECVGIPPYPGDLYPRVTGVLHDKRRIGREPGGLIEVRGDATEPRGSGLKIIAHVVNDKTPHWGAGFARTVKKKWPIAQEDFISWVDEKPSHLALGQVHVTHLGDDLRICHMVAQHGYGPSPRPRIRYVALKECLDKLAQFVLGASATAHMPRIGTGQAGGQWTIVRELVDEALVRRGIQVTVYARPDSEPPKEVQNVLSSGGKHW